MGRKRKPSEPDLAQKIVAAAKEQIKRWDETGIWNEGGYESALFRFVQILKSMPELSSSLQVDEATQRILSAFSPYDYTTLDEIWQVLGFKKLEDPTIEFRRTWKKTLFGSNSDPLTMALAMSRSSQLQPATGTWPSKRFGEFVSLCGWLQVLTFPDPIFLPVRTIGKCLEISPICVSRYREEAVDQGILVLVEPHKFSGSTRTATVYRFKIQDWDCLLEESKRRDF